MSTNGSKSEFFAVIYKEQAGWERLLSEIGEEHMTQPDFAGGWSMKDIIAHLTGWRRRSVQRFTAALHHEPTPPPDWPEHLDDDDEINAWIYAANRDRSLEDVLHDARSLFMRQMETLDAFSEAELRDPARFPWLEGGNLLLNGAAFYEHFHEEHEQDIRAWLGKIKRAQQRTTYEAVRQQRSQAGKEYFEFLRAASMSAGLYELGVGAHDGQQPHTEDELYYVVDGRATLLVGEEDTPVAAGSLVYVPAGVAHHFHDISERLSVLVFFAPAEYSQSN